MACSNVSPPIVAPMCRTCSGQGKQPGRERGNASTSHVHISRNRNQVCLSGGHGSISKQRIHSIVSHGPISKQKIHSITSHGSISKQRIHSIIHYGPRIKTKDSLNHKSKPHCSQTSNLLYASREVGRGGELQTRNAVIMKTKAQSILQV